jgi:hypothetical protein
MVHDSERLTAASRGPDSPETAEHPPMPVIVGVPRSGTTLTRFVIDSHPLFAIPPETHFLPALARLPRGKPSVRDVFAIMTGTESWPDFHVSSDALMQSLSDVTPFSVAACVRAFYRLYASRFGKDRWGEKTPDYGQHMRDIEALLPESRFIHVIRNGLDVAVSVRPLWFSQGRSVRDIARDWRRRLELIRRQGSQCAHYGEIRFESLVTDLPAVARDLSAFLEVPFSDDMCRYYERTAERLAEHEGRMGRHGVWRLTKEQRINQQILTTRPPQADRIDRWRGELSADDVREFQREAGPLLEQLGYSA